MGSLCNRTSPPKIHMYLRPLQAWWVYLGLKSNPAVASMLDDRFDYAVFFDDPSKIPMGEVGSRRVKFFYIFWDGIRNDKAIEEAHLSIGNDADLTVLVVGDSARESCETHTVRSLYPEGDFNFRISPLNFDSRTRVLLLRAKIRGVFVPLKNIFKNKRRITEVIRLLAGKRQIVFCGSFGINPQLMKMLCDRNAVDFRIFNQYECYQSGPGSSPDLYRQYLRSNGSLLANLYDRSEIDAAFFLSMTHLLAREYFIEKIRFAGLRIFTNKFASDPYIDVYTTPFYGQHIFIDFGSVVGAGRYPRLADLRYFKKNVLEIRLNRDLTWLLTVARKGSLDAFFDKEWDLNAPQILKTMK
jgi:hypothetical protein